MAQPVRITNPDYSKYAAFGDAASTAAQSGNNALAIVSPGNWTAVHSPAANTQATASKAAGSAGVRHICEAISATLVAGATAPAAVQLTVNLRDGASGAGTVLWSGVMSLPATAGGSSAPFALSGLNIVGSANTAMTLEFSAAGGLNTVQSVSFAGYDVS